MDRDEIKKFIHDQNLSLNDQVMIDGPWAFRGLHELRAPVYIFVPGGEKVEIGEVVANTDHGLKFDVQLNKDHEDVEVASFEVPMRFHVRFNKN